ncbi:MAG TPA: hypothetical protein ENK45_04085 [Aliiroseovarius sp.]|nr:hypothetical protein [Aliiroseovarius sp.]
MPDTEFWRAWQGSFQGVLRWEAFDALLEGLASSDGDWFAWDMQEPVPAAPAPLGPVLESVRALNAPVRDRSWCGTLYVDDPAAPGFVKAFDPYRMGATCGSSGSRTLPRFVISRLRPDPLPAPEPEPQPGLLARLIGRG